MLAPLSAQQKNIWYIEQVRPNTSLGVIAASGKIKGKIDYFLLQQAINAYVESDDNIRTHITLTDGEPRQYIAEYKPKQIDFFDFSITQKEGLFAWDTAVTQQPFTLLDSDLFYFAIYKINENEGGFLVKTHHIISDGWSIVLIGNHLMDNYNHLLNGEALQKIKPPSYLDFIERQDKYLSSPRYESDKQYWADIVRRIPDQLGLKEYNLSNFSSVAKRKAYIISEKITNRIKYLCDEYRASTFSLLFSILSLYIYRITGRTRLSFGTPVINRQDAEEKSTVGMFINTVPIIIDIDENMSFIEFNKYVIREWLQILRHQQYPYDKIVQEARKHNGSVNKLYDIVISYQNAKLVKGDNFADRMEGRWHFNGHQTHSLFIHISERENDGRILLDYDYLAQIFTSKEIEYIHNHFINLLSDALEHPEKKLFAVDLLDEDEKFRVLKAFNQTGLDYDRTTLIHQFIEKQAVEHPERIAIIHGAERLSYCELDDRAGRLASHLQSQGLGTDGIAAILLKRSPLLLIAMLAVLKAGGAFMPIDPSLPDERISFMLDQSGAAFLLTGGDTKKRLSNHSMLKVMDLDDSQTLNNTRIETGSGKIVHSPNDLAYVIYTSGSTGEPKGVMIEHRSLVNFNTGMLNSMEYVPGSAVLSCASAGFDVFIMETLPTLMNGLQVVIADESEQREPSLIARLIQDNDVRKLYVTPSRLRTLLLDEKCRAALTKLTEIVCGGEEFPPDLVAVLRKVTNATLFNQYGPTEATIGVTLKQIDTAGSVNIGKPMVNTKIYILDVHRNPLPIGVPGEMYIGGECLARGYIGNRQSTDECFVSNPFDASERLYKTGDMARWYPRGEIAFLGRMDEQVKIRGYRIELKEIENCIKKFGMIENVAVKDLEDSQGNRYLCAYIVSMQDWQSKDLKQFLMQQLPHYMLPAFYMQLDSIPLTANGKVDYACLPKPDIGAEGRMEYAAPSNPIETELAIIWQKVLQIDTIGVLDNYFQLGGDSLNAVMMIVEIHRAFNVNLLFTDVYQSPTIRQLAQTIVNAKQSSYTPLRKAPHMAEYPLSPSQKRLYVLNMMEQNKTAYNMPGAFIIKGSLDIERLEKAFRTIIDRHDVFRTSFMIHGDQAMQIIQEDNKFRIEWLDKTEIEIAIKDFVRSFDLSQPPLIRVGIMETSDDEHILLIDMHHIISDGASSAVLMEELNTLYLGGVLGNPDLQYKDYVIWAEETAKSPWMKRQEEYWVSLFKDPPLLDLPTDRPRGEVSDYTGNKIRFALNKQESGKVAAYCKSKNVSLFMFFLANWYMLLSRMSGQDDIVIGTPSLGRRHADLVDIIGAFINVLPIRCKSNPKMTFEQFLNQVKDLTIAALDNQDYPFDRLVENLPIPKDLSRNPLFDTMFVMQTVDARQMKLGALAIEPIEMDSGSSKFDLSLEASAREDTISFTLEYSSRLFERQTMERYKKYFRTLVMESIAHDKRTLGSIECMDEDEKYRLLYEFNKTDKSYTPTPIDFLFDEQAKDHPSKTAVVFHDEEMSYGKLKEMADGIASVLVKEGIGSGSVVGLLFNRGIEMMASVWGIMKSGAAYMPIDPKYPEERIKYMLDISKSELILIGEGISAPDDYSGKTIYINRDTALDPQSITVQHSAEDCAYVLFTSGSTGRPKGVMISHRSVHNLIDSVCDLIPYSSEDIFLCSSTLYFDAFVLVALIPLANGMKVILADEEELMLPWKMAALINKEKVTTLFFTPSRMRAILTDGSFRDSMKDVKYLMLGGEALSADLVRQIKDLSPVRIFNLYGPTEITVCATGTEVFGDFDITIGKALNNTQLFVLDDRMNLLPQGAIGELYVSGDGVSEGYINREDLTRECFISNNFRNHSCMMYRTGDMVRYTNDGCLVYVGRTDNQIKVRGLRIETEEIESQIIESGLALQAFVTPVIQQDHSTALCAYIVLNNKEELSNLKIRLSQKLPDYMVPSYYSIMDSLPLNTSGKVDRKLLPPPMKPESNIKINVNNDSKMVSELCAIWSSVLKKDSIHPEKSFFEQGGDSLSAIIVQTQYHTRGWEMSTRDFFHFPSIMEHVKLLSEQIKDPDLLQDENFPARLPEPVPQPAPKLLNVFLTGVTGYLGTHLMKEILENTRATLWCLVRGDNPLQKVRDSADWYHGEGYLAKHISRIRLINGDIIDECFGLNQAEYDTLAETIDTVIHAAANVKHYGDPNIFNKVNVAGTQHIIDFAILAEAHLFHVSTTSVAADGTSENVETDTVFTEADFYIGQNYAVNDYVRSKFEAEALVIKSLSSGCKATIFRVGNLTGRYADGLFQRNIEDNAFYQYMRAFILTRRAPENVINMELEFTPVDSCAKAIRCIIVSDNLVGRCYHLSNPNRIIFQQLASHWHIEAREFGSENDENIINDNYIVPQTDRSFIFLSDFILSGHGDKQNTITISTLFTESILHDIGYAWPKIEGGYLDRIWDHMVTRGFISANSFVNEYSR